MKNHKSEDIGLQEYYHHFFKISVPALGTFVLVGQYGEEPQWEERNQKIKVFADHLAKFINDYVEEFGS